MTLRLTSFALMTVFSAVVTYPLYLIALIGVTSPFSVPLILGSQSRKTLNLALCLTDLIKQQCSWHSSKLLSVKYCLWEFPVRCWLWCGRKEKQLPGNKMLRVKQRIGDYYCDGTANQTER